MSNRSALASLAALIVMAMVPTPGRSQPTLEQLTLRPGDKIIWTDLSGGHLVQFGGGALKPLADIKRVLTFEPPLDEKGEMGFSQQGGNPMLTATVTADATQSGVAAIDFTCGAHPPSMRSRPFVIAPREGQPVRELKINAKSNPNNWELETSSGAVIIDAALVDPARRKVAHVDEPSHRH
jgi:hypothetical protein